MQQRPKNVYEGPSLRLMAKSKEILAPLQSQMATTKIRALFNYLTSDPKDDLTNPENLSRFAKRCCTREIVGKIKNNSGIEETDAEYKRRIAKEEYNTAKITDQVRLGLDEGGDVHFFIKFGQDEEFAMTTEDTLTVVGTIYQQFIIELEDLEKAPIDYALSKSIRMKAFEEEENLRKEILELKQALKEEESKNNKLVKDLKELEEDAKVSKEEKLKMEEALNAKLEGSMKKTMNISAMLQEKTEKEIKLKNENIKPIQYEQLKEDIERTVIEAAKNGDIKAIAAVVQELGTECLFAKDKQDIRGFTALQWAEENQHYEVAEEISRLRRQGRENKKIEKKEVPQQLQKACAKQVPESLDVLKEKIKPKYVEEEKKIEKSDNWRKGKYKKVGKQENNLKKEILEKKQKQELGKKVDDEDKKNGADNQHLEDDDKKNHKDSSQLESLKALLEDVLGSNIFTKAYQVTKDLLREHEDLTGIEEKYGKDNGYQTVFPFMTKDALERYLPILFTYVIMRDLNV